MHPKNLSIACRKRGCVRAAGRVCEARHGLLQLLLDMKHETKNDARMRKEDKHVLSEESKGKRTPGTLKK